MNRLQRGLRRVAALLALVAAVAGIPVLLLAAVGNPLPGVADLFAGDVSDRAVVDVLAVLGLAAWAQWTLAVSVEIVAQTRHLTVPRIPGVFAGQQQLAHTLVAAALLSAPVVGAAAPMAAGLSSPAPAVLTTSGGSAASAPVAAASPDAGSAAAAHREVVISGEGPGTYWDLANAYLGSGDRWREIWEANQGRRQGDGAVMDRPGLLREGWSVLVPVASEPSASNPASITVVRGDTLSGIATEHDVDSWQTLWELNENRSQSNGRRLSDPDHIELGWQIRLPANAAPEAEPAAQPPEAAPPTQLDRVMAAAATRPTPSPVETASAIVAPAEQVSSAADDDSPAATLLGVGFGSGLLAGVTLTALLSHRRRQSRYRRPGRAIAGTPAALLPVERTLISAGSAGAVDVRRLDEALRGLAQTLQRSPGARLPEVLAARMNDDLLELLLAHPSPTAPGQWTVLDAGRRWQLHRDAETGYDDSRRGHHFAPYPALASVGYTPDGDQWLLDLEQIAAVRLTGDRQRCVDLSRFVAAELAHNVWSEQMDVQLAGFGTEMAELNPDRLQVLPAAEAAERLRSRRAVTHELLAGNGNDVLECRRHDIATDACMPQILLSVDAPPAVQELLEVLGADGVRSGICVIALGEGLPEVGWTLHVDSAGTMRVPALDLELIAHQVPRDEAASLARLLVETSRRDDVPTPPARGDDVWDQHADAAGALLPAITVDRGTLRGDGSAEARDLRVAGPDASSPGSILPQPAARYVDLGTTTRADVQALAPAVTAQSRRHVEAADPGLDDDLALWLDQHTDVPKLSLLGPVDVVASGPLPDTRPRKAWNVEIVAYLASHPRGVTAEQFGTDLWPNDPDIAGKSKLRQAIYIARKWLSTDPRTGRDILPPATQVAGGPSLYRVEGLLVDAELFRRLRIRGVARGADGISDLERALALVTGPPLAQRRPGGYAWLADSPLDHEYTGMIVDVAHLVATVHLAAAEPSCARAAAEVALLAGSTDDIPLLDLVAACDAEGNRAEADRFIQRILTNHDAEVEEDLPPRTAQILHRRWMDQAS